eukprot:TRINITY_DN1508_c0_g1_i4.p1 TRINITY_DN1508_c0_g1~~TRINITY_DN1508_c0_g1_i4.p1  ORF type:complete len:400 (+),score=16.87 TRINITY_DN1508_c0_g1_i4:100-1299(+)
MSTTSTVVGPPVQHEVRGEVLALTLDVEAGRTSFHHGISGDPHVQELNVATNRDHSRRLSPYHPDCTRIKLFVINNFLPLGFLVALVFALSWPQPGQEVASWKIGSIRAIQALNNICVFFISGLTLKSNDLKQALKHWVGIVYCLIAIMLATPCAGFITQHIPFRPREFIEGLTIFCAVPTTLGVGVALVGASNGNQTLALFLTVATNILGIVTVPYVLKLLLLGSSTISINALDLFVKLVITVLVPTLIGKLLNSTSAWVRSFVQTHKVALSLFSTSNLVLIVWQTLSGARNILLKQDVTSVLIILCAVIAQHIGYLVFNTVAVRLLHLPLIEAISIVIMSSQKSAPVAVTIITYISPNISTQGLLSIPALIGQLFQIFLGSAIAKVLAKKVDKEQQD